MNLQPQEKVGITLQTHTGVLKRLQSHRNEPWLPVVSSVYEKLLRNTTSELCHSTFPNYMICRTVLKVWHITQIQLIQSVTRCSPANLPSATLLPASAEASEIAVHGRTAL